MQDINTLTLELGQRAWPGCLRRVGFFFCFGWFPGKTKWHLRLQLCVSEESEGNKQGKSAQSGMDRTVHTGSAVSGHTPSAREVGNKGGGGHDAGFKGRSRESVPSGQNERYALYVPERERGGERRAARRGGHGGEVGSEKLSYRWQGLYAVGSKAIIQCLKMLHVFREAYEDNVVEPDTPATVAENRSQQPTLPGRSPVPHT